MLNTYNHIAALTRLSLNHAFRSLNNTTNKLLSQAGIVRADTNPAPAVLYNLAEADLNALTSGITEANDTISMNQTADAALETIHEKLQQMRALAEEVEYGDLTAEEIQTNADEYESLAAEVQTLLDETTYDDRTLLSGREPVVMFNLESVLEIDLTDMPSGGTFDVSRAMLDVTAAREQLELDNNALAQTITDMESQQDEVLSFASQLATAQQALNTLKATLDQMYSETLGATATQMNITSSDAMRLLS